MRPRRRGRRCAWASSARAAEIVSFTALANAPSRAVMERIGMTDSGEDFDHPALPEGHRLRRHCLYRLRREAWSALYNRAMPRIRRSHAADAPAMLAIVNAAAGRYRGVIPADRWHEPYMPAEEMQGEIAAGVAFWVAEEDGALQGVMGIQDRGEVALVRHAYVQPHLQGRGVGTSLLRHVLALTDKPVLIGTWAAASWAIDFYRRNGFSLVPPATKDKLLATYWTIPARQVETSVVLADARWMAGHREEMPS
jgi:RimJ/RimL family protein N-acetyltransferase